MRIKDKIYPKVLVISHNVLSPATNMGKTMVDFFSGWDKEKITQLYFHNEAPTFDICKQYFRITDFNVLGSIVKIKYQTNPSQIFKEADFQTSIYQIGARRKPYGYFFRNLLWQTKLWKTTELVSWIDNYKPEVVFYAAGDYIFSMKIALDICQERGIPLVAYFGDDFYFSGQHPSKISLLASANMLQFKKEFENLFSYLSTYTAATDKLNAKYSCYFRKKGYAIMNSTNIQKEKVEAGNKTIKISYIGNLILNRWKSLIDIASSLKKLGLVLDVYSIEKDPKILSQLTLENGIQFKGTIPQNMVEKTIKSSTIVIHVEGLDARSKRLTKYSFSTKIGESLGSGVCLFAYGPAEVASIEYLRRNDVACVCTEKAQLQERLQLILEDTHLRQHYVDNALKLASNRHDIAKNADLFHKMICDAVGL